MASVLLCTDEPILAEGLTRVLAPIEGLDLVSWCKGVDELRALLELHQPDVLLVDMTSAVTFTVLSGLHESGVGEQRPGTDVGELIEVPGTSALNPGPLAAIALPLAWSV